MDKGGPIAALILFAVTRSELCKFLRSGKFAPHHRRFCWFDIFSAYKADLAQHLMRSQSRAALWLSIGTAGQAYLTRS